MMNVRASLAEVTFEEAQARAEAALNGDSPPGQLSRTSCAYRL